MSSYTYTIPEFIQSKQTAAERLEAVEICIDKAILMLGEVFDGVGGTIQEYQIDDSQVKIKTVYRSIKEVEAQISALERMRNRYLNQLKGRAFIMKDRRTFK